MISCVKRISLLMVVATTGFFSARSQPLVTYGNNVISKEEFLKAYNKNNSGEKATEQSYHDYLELYIKYKLKVQAAYDLKMDTEVSQQTELRNFRNQVVESYMTDEASMKKLVNEAFERSKKDIHIAHIFIADPVGASPADTLKAFQKINEVYTALKKGKNFNQAASEYSEDPFAKTNHGDIGFITVFTIPYGLENLAYNTPLGQFSKIYRSKAGFHIIKKMEERKSLGRMKAAQILLAFPQGGNEEAKLNVKRLSDSVFDLLKAGADFNELARKVSGDNLTYQTGGEMPEFGIGRYDPVFEKAAFGLEKDGDFSKPVETGFGYHIIKRLSRKSMPANPDKEILDAIRTQVLNDSRVEITKKAMSQKIIQATAMKKSSIDENKLWQLTDSAVLNKKIPKITGMDEMTMLAQFPKKEIYVKDWLTYRKTTASKNANVNNNDKHQLLNEFLETAAYTYYREHAEEYDRDFAYQLNEFKEGNLLFEMMQKQVWDKASADTAGLRAYFNAHSDKYWWEPSVDAIVFTTASDKIASDTRSKLAGNIDSWKKLVDSSGGTIQADSGRFELAQIPAMEKGIVKEAAFTNPVKNQADNSLTFAWIIKDHPEKSQRSYRDARGFVINDYQVFIEERWVGELRNKYPVSINESVYKSLPH